MIFIRLLFLSFLIVEVFLEPQFGSFEIYELDLSNNQFKPYQTNQNSHNHRPLQTTQRPYQNNPFLSSLSNQNQNSNIKPLQDSSIVIIEDTEHTPQASSCENFWSYHTDYFEKWGQIVVPEPHFKKSVIRIVLSLAARLPTRYVGEITLLKDRQSTVNDIANGLPLYYRVKFPLQNPVPKLTAIYYNDRLLCTGPKDVGQFVTTITLDHTLFTGLANPPQRPNTPAPAPPPPNTQPPTHRPYTAPPTRQPEQYSPSVATAIPTASSTYPNSDRFGVTNSDFECGLTDYKAPTTTGLIVGGKNANRGQFPWLAAYYHNSESDYSGFICGGSLISTRLIVTAAHCIQEKHSKTIRKADEATFYIGKHNLESLSAEKYYIISAVTQFVIHQDWNFNDDRYDADIAIAILSRKIPFNKFIKPICLWPSRSDSSDLVGKSGVVVGWGKTEQHAISTASPKWAEIPVVDQLTCLRSNDAFNKLTSERTFCAGNRQGDTGPCSGDSGGGFVTQNENKWFLRGVISSALYDQALGTCDSKNYAVFTDASRFHSWLQGHIQTYG